MSTLIQENFFLIFTVMTFVASVLLFESLYMLWVAHHGPEVRRIEQRLRAISVGNGSGVEASVLKNRVLSHAPPLNRMLLSVPRIRILDRFVLQSGLDWTVAKLLLMSLLLGAGSFIGIYSYWKSLSPAFYLLASIALALLPFLYVQLRRNRRLAKLEQQLPDALDLMGRALRAGHSFPAALKMIGEEMADPVGREFSATHDEVNFGVSLQQALTNLGQRVPITDIRFFVVAVLIQRETGGNLTELLTNLSKLIRSRLQLHAKIKVLTAEGRISAWTLGLLPFALAALMHLGNSEFISVLWTDPSGIQLTQVTLGVMAVGALWLWQLTKVRV
jgi:tight adherence protein B